MAKESPDTRDVQGRREATVMFADIAGFTALSEKLDPEDVTAIMNACFERIEAIVLVHGGIVDEYLGDCVKAAFGFSPAIGNPAQHALLAALEIRDAIDQFNRDTQPPSPLGVHIGINTGEVTPVVMSDSAAQDFSVMGEAVRVAARLEDASETGQIFVGARTVALAADDFEFRPALRLDADQPTSIAVLELTARTPHHRATRQSERRLATIVFADVLGVDALVDRLGSEAATDFLRGCFEGFGATVAAYGGVVDKLTGDGLMALFGIPNALEDAPKQALNAAIEMRQQIAERLRRDDIPVALDVHIGINTGLVIAGHIGGRLRRDFTAMGDTVNLAARLKETAAAGAIVVSAETHRYTRHIFEYRALEPLRLKGKAQPVAAYLLLSATKQLHRTSAARDRRVFSPLVGRDGDIARFRAAIEALAAGRGAIVDIIGEAGLGKSRLLAEGVRLATTLDVRVLLGRSLSVGGGRPFHPFIDLLRHWLRLDEEAADVQVSAALESAIEAALAERAGETFPFIARLLGLPLTGEPAARVAGIEGEALETLIVKSVRELLHAVARQRPTALIFEDLHWADQSSLKLLEAVLPLHTEVPLAFVHVCRPLAEDTSDRVVALCRERFAAQHTEIRLEKLTDADAAALIRNLLHIDELPPALCSTITRKADGNPFYIEEVVRSLIDAGGIEYRDGGFLVTDKLATIEIPGTIHDVIMARVDRLDESARRLLQIASVIGRRFYHPIIARLSGAGAAIDADLTVLRDKQLIESRDRDWEIRTGDRTVTDELEYIFKHALAQEAVYESILLKTRKELHGRVADTIAATFAERIPEFYSTLAYHYTRAERWEPAEDYLCRAGEAAARAAASRDALDLFRQAAGIYDRLHGVDGGEPGHRALLAKNIGLALLNTGQHAEAVTSFDRAFACLGESVERNLVRQASRWALDMAVVLFRVYVRDGRRGPVANLEHEREIFKLYFERGKAEVYCDPRRLFFETATPIRRYHRLEPTSIQHACAMYVSTATIFAYSGVSYTIAKRMLEVAGTLLQPDDIRDVFPYRTMRYTFEYLRGNWSDPPLIEDALIGEALRNGMVWDVTLYIGLEMDRRLRRGDFSGARALQYQLAHIRDTYAYAWAGSNHDGMLAILLVEQRQLAAAVRLAEHHLAVSREPPVRVMAAGLLAKALLLLGERDRARAALAQAATITTADGVISPWHQSIHHVAQLLHDVTALETGAGRRWRLRRAAVRSARRALGSASKVAKERTETYTLTGRLWWACGARGRARKWWRRSLREAQRLGAAPELARAWTVIGRRIGNATFEGKTGAAYLESARTLFTQLGLTADLAELGGAAEAPVAADVAAKVA